MFNKALVNLSTLKNNIKIISNLINKSEKKDIKILSVIKADAYGHGIVEIAKASEDCGVYALGVATIEEAIKLRENGIKTKIVLLFQHFKDESELVCKYDITPIISNDSCLEEYDKYLEKYNKTLNLYIKVDTGLHRMGVSPNDVLELSKKVLSYSRIKLDGINTHYAASDSKDKESIEFTNKQISIFNEVLNNLKKHNIKINIAHTSNSGAIESYRESYFDMTRAGIILYGYPPSGFGRNGIRPIMDLKTKVILIKSLKKGESVSYGMTYKAKEDTKIALLPIGYADGIPRALSNNWEVKINGKYYPIRGRICMDNTIIEIFNDNINIEDEVLIFGDDEKLNAFNLAKNVNSITHEILCGIGNRVKRVYI